MYNENIRIGKFLGDIDQGLELHVEKMVDMMQVDREVPMVTWSCSEEMCLLSVNLYGYCQPLSCCRVLVQNIIK